MNLSFSNSIKMLISKNKEFNLTKVTSIKGQTGNSSQFALLVNELDRIFINDIEYANTEALGQFIAIGIKKAADKAITTNSINIKRKKYPEYEVELIR